jgi:hypothetical protein
MRVIALIREARTVLTAAGWSVREGPAHSGGTVDLAAQRTWRGGELEAVLHLLVTVDPQEGELEFLDIAGKIPHAPITFSLGDDDPALQHALGEELFAHVHALAYRREQSITAPVHVDAPPARTRASLAAGSFTRAFDALDGVRDDLLTFALEMLADDGEPAIDPFIRRRDLLHAIVITGRTMRPKSIRLEQSRVIGADYRWIDVVRSNAFADYANSLTRHYASRFARRRFTAA